MGAYLSEPMTQKQSEDGEGNKLKFGACSMQGWRVSQEDAHNCIASFDDNASLFAVYDGHGGAEVAIYLSKHLPDTLKACISYKNGEFVKALEECYLKIDASIKTPEVLKEIQQLAKSANRGENDEEAAVDYEEENVGQLYEEATMPLDKLVAKYSSSGEGVTAAGEEEDTNCKPGSSRSISFVSASSSSADTSKAGGSGSSSTGASSASVSSSSSGSAVAAASSSTVKVNGTGSCSSEDNEVAPSCEDMKTETNEADGNELIVEGKRIKLAVPDVDLQVKDEPQKSQEVQTKDEEMVVSGSSSEAVAVNGKSSAEDAITEYGDQSQQPEEQSKSLPSENGEAEKSVSDKTVNAGGSDNTNGESTVTTTTSETTSTTAAEQTPRRKKVHPVPMAIPDESNPQEKRNCSPRKSAQFANEAGFGCSDSEDSDEEDAGYNMGDRSDDSSDLEDEEEDLGEDSDEEEDEDTEEDERFLNLMQEPGYDSGATAVVCYMKWEADGLSLWVANAGDSRCVVCREGKAIDMSHDHKPELDVEAQRIVKAGGKVTEDGRVNGGLNLSRALGDHSYKQNPSLPPEEQMISPLPSVEHIVLNPAKDKFLVLACDGIWNSMSSQEVVDFVGKRLENKDPLSKICEELFDTCLAPDTCGDGTGCDNMTCIIVQLSDAPEIYSGSKRKISPSEPDSNEESATETSKKSRVEVEEG